MWRAGMRQAPARPLLSHRPAARPQTERGRFRDEQTSPAELGRARGTGIKQMLATAPCGAAVNKFKLTAVKFWVLQMLFCCQKLLLSGSW